MFFVYEQTSKQVHEFKDFTSLADHYKKTSVQNSSDWFWTLGLKSWLPITDVLTDDIVQTRKCQLPALPSASHVDELTSPGMINPISDEITGEIHLEKNDFVIVSYGPATTSSTSNSTEETKTVNLGTVEASSDTSADSAHVAAETAPNSTATAATPSAAVAAKPGTPGFQEQRKSPRFDIRLKVIISNKEKTFLSYTMNVSTGGVMLEDNIPRDYFNSETEIFISSPKKNEFVAFRCQPVGDDTSPKRFSFGQVSQASLEKFQAWIEKMKAA